jgi:hypothetical protein
VKRAKRGTPPRASARKKQLGRYKSGLEKQCADLLCDHGLDFDYEEVEYTLVDQFKYEGVYHKMTASSKELSDRTGKAVLAIKYTPDFVAKDRSWIIETKGFTPSHHDFPMRWKLFLRYLSDLGKTPKLFIVKNREQIEEAIRIIKNDGHNKVGASESVRTRYRKDTDGSRRPLRGAV